MENPIVLFIMFLVFGLLAYALGFADGVKREQEIQHYANRHNANNGETKP